MNTLRRFWTVAQFVKRGGGIKATARLAQAAPKYLALYQRLLTDPRVPPSAKAVFVGAGAFAVSPLNVPGFIPVIGALDDIGILLMAEGYFRKRVPAEVLAEHRAAVGLADDMPLTPWGETMSNALRPRLEHPIAGFDVSDVSGEALARAVEAHPALTPLLDFYSADPAEIAAEVGMLSPHDPEDADDLQEIDLGPWEWFEPTAGLAAVRHALTALRDDPASLAAAVYDPSLRPQHVIADLEAVEGVLLLAQQHETRFHFALN